ncbi:MAG TPA: type IV toxin-antitoxin system AbiEi family antitoxin domain-containing protein [Gaiellaceae bacterium]|nr:type IV toxin-antitoxin system AbiEi family antitoxin domain-containing protein [Gaiellaceae bacterium]
MTTKLPDIPTFPLPHYRYPRDRLRHWAALQGDRVFSPTEMLVGAGLLSARAAIRDLVRDGELTRLGHNKLQVAKLRPIIDALDPHHETRRRHEVWKLLQQEVDRTTGPPFSSGKEDAIVRDHWPDLWWNVKLWFSLCLRGTPWVEKPLFTDVPVRTRHAADYGPIYDFWRRSDLETLDQAPSHYIFGQGRRGTRQTAAMLGHAQNSEDVTAIWIAAFAFDNVGGRNHLEHSWRGRVHAMIRVLECIVRRYFDTRDYLYDWHPSMTQVRPANSLTHLSGSILPKSLNDCVGVAALDAILSHALYVPVRFVPTDPAGDKGTGTAPI